MGAGGIPTKRAGRSGRPLARLGKVHRLEIYPPVGQTAPEGHGFVHLRVATWEPDVFALLDPLMQ